LAKGRKEKKGKKERRGPSPYPRAPTARKKKKKRAEREGGRTGFFFHLRREEEEGCRHSGPWLLGTQLRGPEGKKFREGKGEEKKAPALAIPYSFWAISPRGKGKKKTKRLRSQNLRGMVAGLITQRRGKTSETKGGGGGAGGPLDTVL